MKRAIIRSVLCTRYKHTYAGEIFSNQISAKPDTENKIKGHVELK